MGTLLFVHGTGVRLSSYRDSFEQAKKAANSVGITHEFKSCAWGDPLGVTFEGLSLPDYKGGEDGNELTRWSWLFADPLFELAQLTIRDSQASPQVPMPGQMPEWEELWGSIADYTPSVELGLLLDRASLKTYWDNAWGSVIQGTEITHAAFEASAHELAEATHATARALIAQLHVMAVADGNAGPSRYLRDLLFQRLIEDWDQNVLGLSSFFSNIFKRAATNLARTHRTNFCHSISFAVGDILLYQSKGESIRGFIKEKIAESAPPVVVVAHSLGGIACVDLFALPNAPSISHLVTIGSQSALLSELGALHSSSHPCSPLPDEFPPWLNIFDRNDFLSFPANNVWDEVTDWESESGQPFPDSHSAYYANSLCWESIRDFIQ